MNNITEAIVTIATAIVGVAILSVLVSRNSQTPNVLSAAGNAFSTALGAATAPVTGGGMAFPTGNLSSFGGLSLPNY
ncbi:MAG: hypothetical protein KGL39_36565 [Patescibacteria group bacterium]|nr:hypothetical protein [Patescibacteria group bacterium]